MEHAPTWLIANWKMNGSAARVQAWATAIERDSAKLPKHISCVLCPPFPYLSMATASGHLQWGAQNAHAASSGAYTGEVAAAMLAEIGCRYVIVGHSERRAAGESDADALAKAKAVVAAGMLPVICVGESRAAYEENRTAQVLDGQLLQLSALAQGSYLIAYEPIWAIGSQQTPQMVEIQAAHRHIKSVLGSATPVLYGGSVNASNLQQILGLPEVSGGLIGGASLEIESMRAMITIAQNVRG
jgi:triosephosphate isomerase